MKPELFTIARRPAAQAVLKKASCFLQNLEQATEKTMGERVEEAVAKIVTNDNETQFVLQRLKQKLGYIGTFVIIPDVDDTSMNINGYGLYTYGQPVITAPSLPELNTQLTSLVLTTDEAKLETFMNEVEGAYDASHTTSQR
jgi:hypothetical protein